jgi:hypothetical protein
MPFFTEHFYRWLFDKYRIGEGKTTFYEPFPRTTQMRHISFRAELVCVKYKNKIFANSLKYAITGRCEELMADKVN